MYSNKEQSSSKAPTFVKPPLEEGSVRGSHPDLHSLIRSLREENNRLKKENESLRTILPPDIKSLPHPINTGSVQGSVKGSVQGSVKGSVQGSVKGSVQGSVKGSVQGSVKGSVQGSVKGSVRGSIKGSARGSFKGSVIGSHDEGLTRDEDINELILQYPKVQFQIGIETIHSLNCYIKVWTKVRDRIALVGTTETIQYDGTMGVYNFIQIFEITYLIGIDSNQMVIFEIFAGDLKKIRSGYFWGSLSTKLPFIIRADSIKLDIYRGEDSLGLLHLKPAVGTPHEETVSLKAAGSESMLFFKPKIPTLDSLREAIPSIKQMFAFYNIEFNTSYICQVNEEVFGECGSIFMKICLNRPVEKKIEKKGSGDEKKGSGDEKKDDKDEKIIEKPERVYKESPTSRNLVELWKSSQVTKKPYDVKILELKFSHEDITDDSDLRVPINEDAKLIFQIYLDGIFNSPKLVHYTQISVKDFIEKCKTDKKNKSIPYKLNFTEVFNMQTLEKKETKSNKKEEDNETKSNNSFDDEIEAVCKTVNLEDDNMKSNVEEDEKNEEDTGKSTKKKRNPFIEIKAMREKLEFELSSGDFIYEKKLREMLAMKKASWQSTLRNVFFDAWSEQSKNIANYTSLMEASLDGWSLNAILIADLHFACLQHAAYKLNPDLREEIQVSSTFLGSSVVDAIKLVYSGIAPLLHNQSIKAFAGGGVGAPHSDYPSCASCRHVGLPLVQEYLINLFSNKDTWKDIRKRMGESMHYNTICGTEDSTDNYIFACQDIEDFHNIIDPPVYMSKTTINPLIACLENNKDFETWGGYEYVESATYNSWTHLYSGILEATALYLPCLLVSDSNDDSQSVRSTSKSVKSFKSVKSAKSEISNSSHQSNSKTIATNFTTNTQREQRELKKNKLRSGISTCGITKPLAQGKRLFEIIDLKLKTHSSEFDIDLEFINAFLQHRDKNIMPTKQADVLLWTIGKSPPPHLLPAFGAMIERHILSENKTALIIVLSAENRFDLGDDNSQKITATASPFYELLKVYYEALGRAKAIRAGNSNKTRTSLRPNDETKFSKIFHDGAYNLCLVHFVTFKEIMMQSFLEMDRTIEAASSNKQEKKSEGDLLPTYGAVFNILRKFLSEATAESITGLDILEENDDAPDDSASGLANEDETKSKVESEKGGKAKKMEENIDEQSEVLELKVQFDVERDEVISRGIPSFLAAYVGRMRNEKESFDKNIKNPKNCMDDPQVICPVA